MAKVEIVFDGKAVTHRSRVEPRVATYCDCGAPLAGFAGVITCSACGRSFAVSRMPLGVLAAPS